MSLLNEGAQILIPTREGYKVYPLLILFGFKRHLWKAHEGFGQAPVQFITQRSTFQDGETLTDARTLKRVSQIVISERVCNRVTFWDRKDDLLRHLRAIQRIDGVLQRSIYRRWLPGGVYDSGTDLQVQAGVDVVRSLTARFVDRGGLHPGDFILIEGVKYIIVDVPNDYTLILDQGVIAPSGPEVVWSYLRRRATRDLFFVVEKGPQFDEGPGPQPFVPTGYIETIRMISHDPFWYGRTQIQRWAVADDLSHLTLGFENGDDVGDWMGEAPGEGTWLFADDTVGDVIQVAYWGTERARPEIFIQGPAENVQVVSLTTGRRFTLDYFIPAGVSALINILDLTAYDSTGTNLMPYISGDLTRFGIEPSPEALDGVNQIQIAFNNAKSDSFAEMRWRNLYTGS